jgi:hypothetical protein
LNDVEWLFWRIMWDYMGLYGMNDYMDDYMGLYCLALWGFADSMDDYNPIPRKIHEPTIFLWHGTRGI